MGAAKIIECPRDAWQGLAKFIPTEAKTGYLGKLIEAGFRHIDAVSFVSPKYVPQMADSELVMSSLVERIPSLGRRDETERVPNPESRAAPPEIIGIAVNERGLERALATAGVATIGYPHSISAKFLWQNAHLSFEGSRALVEKFRQMTRAVGRSLAVYISMAFGNPYGEPWSPEIVAGEIRWLISIGVRTVSLADTVGKAHPEQVSFLIRAVKECVAGSDGLEIGVHLHSRPEGAAEKVLAAYDAGCCRFEGALTGLGGCPFADDELVGNIPTEIVVAALSGRGATVGIEPWAMLSAVEATREIRRHYAQ